MVQIRCSKPIIVIDDINEIIETPILFAYELKSMSNQLQLVNTFKEQLNATIKQTAIASVTTSATNTNVFKCL